MHSNVYISSEPHAAYLGILCMAHYTTKPVLLTEYIIRIL